MAALRDIKRKIDAVKKTQQITKAMNMVAAAKLRKMQQAMEEFVPYAEKFTEVIGRVAAGVNPEDFDLICAREEINNIELVFLTADRGLCGGFNTNLLNLTEKFKAEKEQAGLQVSLTSLGKKGTSYFKHRKVPMRATYEGFLGSPNYEDARKLGDELIGLFETGACEEVYLVYSHFYSMARIRPTVIKLLPIEPEERKEEDVFMEYIFEPSHAEVLNDLLPNHIYIKLLESFYLTAVSEHAARMTAMDNATNNCKELIHDLTLTFNKARQAAITKELMDIVGGVEALKKK